ncbi:MAG TPA: hypothetical protein VGL15_07610 [Vicinamibacteria bacterium]|jgi:hypothetical protein
MTSKCPLVGARSRRRLLEAALLLVAVALAAGAEARALSRSVNARVVAIDAAARTITVRVDGAAKDETFVFVPRPGDPKPGDRVVLALRGAGRGLRATVTRIVFTPSPAAASPQPSRPPTDTVGPLRDPRTAPGADPRKDPLRDPRVIPGLSVPAPTPTPTPTPSPSG